MTEVNYETMDPADVLKVAAERGIKAGRFTLLDSIKKIVDFTLDDFSLCRTLERIFEEQESAKSKTPELALLRQISLTIRMTCQSQILMELFLIAKEAGNENDPNIPEPFASFDDLRIIQLITDRKLPLQGIRNVTFRDHIARLKKSLQFCIDTDWRPEWGGDGKGYWAKGGRKDLNAETFESCKEIWRDSLERYDDLIGVVVGDVFTTPIPTLNYLGEFEVDGPLLATDPCYGKDYHERGLSGVLDAQPGTWVASVCNGTEPGPSSWGYRCMHLLVTLKDFEIDPTQWKEHDSSVSVDSGQGGFYCYSQFPDKGGDDAEFYDGACGTTSDTDFSAGIHPSIGGVTSSAGYGDGGYSLYYVKNEAGKVCAAKIVYIGEDWGSTDPGMIKFEYIFRRTSELADLEDGWNGEGSKAPSMKVLEFARQFALDGFAPDFIFSTNEGDVTLYRIKRDGVKWVKYAKFKTHKMKLIDEVGGSVTVGKRGARDLIDVVDIGAVFNDDRDTQKDIIRTTWELTDPKEEGSD